MSNSAVSVKNLTKRCSKIVALDECRSEPPSRSIKSDPHAGDATTDDEYVEWLTVWQSARP